MFWKMPWILYQFDYREMHDFGLLMGHTWVHGLQGKKIAWFEKDFNNREYAHTENT